MPSAPQTSYQAKLDAELEAITAEVANLPRWNERRAAGILRAALKDVRASLQYWLVTAPNGSERYTAQRHRITMLQLETALSTLKRDLADDMADEFDAMDDRARKVSARLLRKEVLAGSEAFGVGVAPSLTMALEVDRGENWRIRHYRTSAARYAGRVRSDIQRQFATGVALRETFDEMTNRLRRLGGPRGMVALRGIAGEPGAVVQQIEEGLFRRYRHWASRLVRTEMIAAYNRHHHWQLEEHEKTDPGWLLRWDASQDARTCVVCAGLHGKEIALDGQFDATREQVRHPPAHPNCRCAAVAWREEWNEEDGPEWPDTMMGQFAAGDLTGARATMEAELERHGYVRLPRRNRSMVSREIRENVFGMHRTSGPNEGQILVAPELVRSVRRLAGSWSQSKAKTTHEFTEYAALQAKYSKQKQRVKVLDIEETEAYRKYGKPVDPLALIMGTATDAPALAEVRSRVAAAREDLAALRKRITQHPGSEHTAGAAALRSVWHEVLHGYGPATKRAYEGAGLVVEEISTEILAREHAKRSLGVSRVRGGYLEWTMGLTTQVAKRTGLPEEDAEAAILRAAEQLKRHTGTARTPEAMVEYFVENGPLKPKDIEVVRDAL